MNARVTRKPETLEQLRTMIHDHGLESIEAIYNPFEVRQMLLDALDARKILEPWLMHHPTCAKIEARRSFFNAEKAKQKCSCGLDKAMGVDA